jgi:SAM-dependent methyltransferase
VLRIQLLGERYRFVGSGAAPAWVKPSARKARKLFFDEIHRKDRYVEVKECPYCGSDDLIKISEVEGRMLPSDIALCGACDGCFKLRVMSDEATVYYYENLSYALRGKDVTGEAMERLFKKRVKRFAYPRYRFINRFIRLNPCRDLVAEFGSNDGANLIPWKDNGYRVLGLDIDPMMAQFGRRKGIDIMRGDISSFDFKAERPRLILLSHVLEHVREIDVVVKRLISLLRPDGYLFIEVPGIRVQGVSDALAYFDMEHNYNFDRRSIVKVLERNSFKALYSDEYIRLICTPARNLGAYGTQRAGSLTPSAAARSIGRLIGILDRDEKRLRDLLSDANSRRLGSVFLRKLRNLYFRLYYSIG